MALGKPDAPIAKFGGARTLLVVPMLKEDELIGAIGIYRQEVRPFTDKQIELVKNFAAQAVIAIENVRLLNELRARTDDLARSVGELQALGEVSQAVNSTLDLETGADHHRAARGPAFAHRCRRHLRVRRGAAGVQAPRHLRHERGDDRRHHRPPHRHRRRAHRAGGNAAQADPGRPTSRNEPSTPVNEINLREGYRAVLIVPLLRPDHIVGALVVRRKTPGEFPQVHHRPAGDLRRPVGGGDPERAAVPARSRRRASSSRSPASTSRSSSPT